MPITNKQREAVITATVEEKALVRKFTGRTIYSPVEWNDLMAVVNEIDKRNYSYKVLICKYSCSIYCSRNNQVIIKNPNPDRVYDKNEAVWMTIIQFLKWYYR